MNSRITARERGLIKGAIRRAFSRSDLRRAVVDACITNHTDLGRPRVKTWCLCAECKKPTPKSYIIVDHILPVIPLERSFEEMSLDEVVDRMWCDIKNLQSLCETCHDVKTKAENKIRRQYKKERKNEGSKAIKKSVKTAIARRANKRIDRRSRSTTGQANYRKTRRNRKKA